VIGSSSGSQYTSGIIVSNYYARNSSADDTVVTAADPLTTGFITGGGYLVNQSSSGQYPGDPGLKSNFGFNVKYNKGGTNLQGQMNTIVRNGGRVYQIKGNSVTSLATTPSRARSTQPSRVRRPGPSTTRGSIQDITNPAGADLDRRQRDAPGDDDRQGRARNRRRRRERHVEAPPR
jgi:hypothetical protein